MTKIGHIDILDLKTGEVARSDELLGSEFNQFDWTDGNDSSDCNRILYFLRAKGFCTEDEMESDSYIDGEMNYRVRIYDLEGRLLFDDTEAAGQNAEMIDA
jgi:hypothetical protein